MKSIPEFWAKVDRSAGPDGCWPWLGACDKDGYGIVYYMGKHQKAHRIAYELTYGPLKAGMFACHQCDSPSCCNPADLFEGTPADNMTDKVIKGRAAMGEDYKSAKLTDETVRELRILSAQGMPQRALARRYGCSRNAIRLVLEGKTWKHVA